MAGNNKRAYTDKATPEPADLLLPDRRWLAEAVEETIVKLTGHGQPPPDAGSGSDRRNFERMRMRR